MNLKIFLIALVALLLVVLVGNTSQAQPPGYGVLRVEPGVPLYRAPVRNGVRLTALGIARLFRPIAYSPPTYVVAPNPNTLPRVQVVNPPVCEKCGNRHWPK